jgi:hypothetical protein
MGEWTPALDSAHQIGPLTLSLGILIAVDGCKRRGYKIPKIGNVLLHRATLDGRPWRREPEVEVIRVL